MAANGRLTSAELVEVHQPLTKHSYLAKAKGAAAANNTLWMAAQHHMGIDFYATGGMSDYRTYGQQEYLWDVYQRGGNLAARPGTSNHGWGLAKDVAQRRMLLAIQRFGSHVGCRKIEAPGEWWHYNFVGFGRPDPGLDIRNPIARRGSGGPAQAWYVKRLQQYLKAHGAGLRIDGEFGPGTERLVKHFQKAKSLKADGVVGATTWRLLRRKPTKDLFPEQPVPKPAPTPVNPISVDRKIIAVLEKYRMHEPKTIIAEARRAKITIRLAASLLNMETGGGFNIWGNDRPPNGQTSHLGSKPVTERDYNHYLTHRGSRGQGGMQGVGGNQLTWYSFQDEADRLGGCWKTRYNYRVGFAHLGSLIKQFGKHDGARRYNGSGPAAEAYARRLWEWHDVWTKRMKEGGVM